jgi:hypothetical protein
MNLSFLADAVSDVAVFKTEVLRHRGSEQVTGADHVEILRKATELADNFAGAMYVLETLAARSFQADQDIHKLIRTAHRAYNAATTPLSTAARDLSRHIIRTRTPSSEKERIQYPGNVVRGAVGDANSTMYDTADALARIRYVTAYEMQRITQAFTDMTVKFTDAVHGEITSCAEVCQRCNPGHRSSNRSAAKIGGHLDEATQCLSRARTAVARAAASTPAIREDRAAVVLGG